MRLHWKAKVKELNAEYAELLARKKAAYDDEGNADPLQARAGHLEEKGACSAITDTCQRTRRSEYRT